jgi:hypothetical protein
MFKGQSPVLLGKAPAEFKTTTANFGVAMVAIDEYWDAMRFERAD